MRVVVYDTAGPVIGVAVADGDRVVCRTERVSRGAEARLAPWTKALCSELGVSLQTLDGVGVAEGPGAFTGVRVGLAAASGLAMALGVPLCGVSSLHSRALAADSSELPVLSMLDARKKRVYAAVYAPNGERIAGPGDVSPAVALQWMNGPFLATGEGSVVYRDLVEAQGGRVLDTASEPGVHAMATLCQRALDLGLGKDPVEVMPVYLREPDAKPPRGL